MRRRPGPTGKHSYRRPVNACGGMCKGGQQKPPYTNTTVCVMLDVCLGLCGLVVCMVGSWSQGLN